jgi:hypothetical protein
MIVRKTALLLTITGLAFAAGFSAGTRHQDVNVGDGPIEVMVVELQNAK